MEGQLTIPVHRDDPASSRDAADRVRPRVGSQLQQVLAAIFIAGPDGASNREIQVRVANGHHPGHPAWNKVPTRCRTLEKRGMIEMVTDDKLAPVLREHSSGGRFLVWRVK
jgi:hypothetical protein